MSKEEQDEINEIKEVLNSIIVDNHLKDTDNKNENSDIDEQNITLTPSIISDKKKNHRRKNYKKRFNKKSKKPTKQTKESISSEKETINHNKPHPSSESNNKANCIESTNKEDHSKADNVEEGKIKSTKKRYGKFNHNKRISYLIPTDAIPIVLSNNFNHRKNYPNDNYRSFSPKYIRVPFESPLEVRSNYSYKNNYNLIGNSQSNQRGDVDKKYDDNMKQKKYYHKQQYKHFPIRMNDTYYNHNPFPRFYNGKNSKENNIENKPNIETSSDKELIAIKNIDEVHQTEELATITNNAR